ncbi:hypothetical protein HanPI659440_Chr07g0253151 [Helianthus annuus]|nr:hypothetical protein HanPI659440_Chr07g0253151 [Helianthus annuus]
MDDLDSSDEELLRRKREAGVQVGEGGSKQYEGPRQSDYSWGVFNDDMQARVQSSQPPEYVGWEMWQQSLYDQGSRLEVSRERQHEEMMGFLRHADSARHISGEMELNMRAYDENQTRHYHDYYVGVPYCGNPPHVDYSQLPPYEPGMPRHPIPQVHGSMWLPREYSEPHFQSSYPYQPPPYEYSTHQQAAQSSSSQSQQRDPQGGGMADIFDMSSFYEHLGGYYGGPPGPSYQ